MAFSASTTFGRCRYLGFPPRSLSSPQYYNSHSTRNFHALRDQSAGGTRNISRSLQRRLLWNEADTGSPRRSTRSLGTGLKATGLLSCHFSSSEHSQRRRRSKKDTDKDPVNPLIPRGRLSQQDGKAESRSELGRSSHPLQYPVDIDAYLRHARDIACAPFRQQKIHLWRIRRRNPASLHTASSWSQKGARALPDRQDALEQWRSHRHDIVNGQCPGARAE